MRIPLERCSNPRKIHSAARGIHWRLCILSRRDNRQRCDIPCQEIRQSKQIPTLTNDLNPETIRHHFSARRQMNIASQDVRHYQQVLNVYGTFSCQIAELIRFVRL